ncbi:Histone H2A-Bbd type 1 [Galemys pyrenaicus]|uniref:Histone H2A-Bbd type 1 n=1 Tax=Galemys pyrenaicus TaxID=202257 RepID=A0A8J6AB17_GALPY|nr:Histone H2A-Bbd type 1 [Galemys pyrenaicus]
MFPGSLVNCILRESCYAQRLKSSTPVFLPGTLEYLRTNILELASKEAQHKCKMLITSEHVEKAVDRSQHLSLLSEDKSQPQIKMLQPSRKEENVCP